MGRNGTATSGQSIIEGINRTITDENVLGFQVYWTLYSKEPVNYSKNKVNKEEYKRINVSDFKMAMEANGFDEDMMRLQTDKKRFLEVITNVCSGYEKESYTNGQRHSNKFEAKKLYECEGKLAMKIVCGEARIEGTSKEELYKSGIDYSQDTTIIFDNNYGSPKIEGQGIDEIVKKVQNEFKAYRDKTSVEFVRFTFTDLLKKHGAIPMRGSGGIYFMPFVKANVIEGIQNLATDFNLGTIYQLRLPSGVAEIEGIKDSVYQEAETRLLKYESRVKTINKVSTLKDKEIEAKAEVEDLFTLYSDILSESVNVEDRQAEKDSMFEDLRKRYDEMGIAITERMTEIDKEK